MALRLAGDLLGELVGWAIEDMRHLVAQPGEELTTESKRIWYRRVIETVLVEAVPKDSGEFIQLASALEALNHGERHPLLKESSAGRNNSYSRWELIVHGLHFAAFLSCLPEIGGTQNAAQIVADAFGYSASDGGAKLREWRADMPKRHRQWLDEEHYRTLGGKVAEGEIADDDLALIELSESRLQRIGERYIELNRAKGKVRPRA